MGIDDRDYMRERGQGKDWSMGTRRVSRASKIMGNRFVKAVVGVFIASSVFAILNQLPNIKHRFQKSSTTTEFPRTGEVRWFIAPPSEPNSVAPLSITGSHDAGKNVIVRLDTWDTRAPVAMIPIRGGETANLQIPLGRYRLMYSANAEWRGEVKIFGDVQEAVNPLEFYRSENQVTGYAVDLNSRLDGNMKTKPAGLF